MVDYKGELIKDLHNKKCPSCECKDVDVDNWGMFRGESDWFYYCKRCDYTFV
ncbi:MAG: hypothetical protein ACRC7N_13500 [Clostridium sp.]